MKDDENNITRNESSKPYGRGMTRRGLKPATRNNQPSRRSLYILMGLLLVFLALAIIIYRQDVKSSPLSAEVSDDSKNETTATENIVVDEVRVLLDNLDEDTRISLASTSINGYQGDIVGTEPYGDDGIKVIVSTHYDNGGYDNEGGKNIARSIFTYICLSAPEISNLSSVYVTSTKSSLDSQSVYRNDVPACKQ